VVDQLEIFDIVVLYLSSLKGKLQVKEDAIDIWILNPSSFNEGSL
jgi:hypothetical protein